MRTTTTDEKSHQKVEEGETGRSSPLLFFRIIKAEKVLFCARTNRMSVSKHKQTAAIHLLNNKDNKLR